MIEINSDMPLDFKPMDSFFDLLSRDSNETELFNAIREHLEASGVVGGYSIGRLGSHEELSLLKNDGYWVVAYSERGVSHFLGIFRSYVEATEFFIWSLVKPQPPMLNWTAVFGAKR